MANQKNLGVRYCFLFLMVILFAGCKPEYVNFNATDLRCCNLLNPEGIESPSFSWKIKTAEQGIAQTAWEIQIASSEKLLAGGKAEVWKSGKQLSDAQFNIVPDNITLEETGKYFWRVRVWNNSGNVSNWSYPASFSIGLLNEDSWPEMDYLSLFKRTCLAIFPKSFSNS